MAAAFVIGALMSLIGGCLMGMAFPGTCLFWVIAGVAGYVGCGSRAMAFWRMDEKIFEQPPKLHPPIQGRLRWIAFWLLLGSLAVPATAEETGVNVPSIDGSAVPAFTPSELSERERFLLDRIERLEKRLADLEADGTETPSVGRAVPTVEAKPAVPEKPQKPEPFAFADFTWTTGNSRQTDYPLKSGPFTGEVRVDANYVYDLNHPKDHTLVGSSEIGRTQEFQLQQFGIGGDFNWKNVRARLLTQFGMYSTMTPRNDASPARGQWKLDDAYRYLAEAYGGYHINAMNGINVDYGIFMSYIGLFSYYQFDNWAYQPSYVSSNTPWFFNGLRVQLFTSDKLKIEPWLINGWQSYGMFNSTPGVGTQIQWRPNGNIVVISNNYWLGKDTLGNPGRKRIHTDDSIQVKYYDNPGALLSKAAFTVTVDVGCEYGGGVSCGGGTPEAPSQYFLGFMVYHRAWFDGDRFALTLGAGAINNPGRYLVLVPPINGATAASGTPYFTASPGDPFKAWDASVTFDYMPYQFTTFRLEYNHRAANVPYFAGPGGVTPTGGNSGPSGSFVSGFTPDLVKSENRFTLGLLVKL